MKKNSEFIMPFLLWKKRSQCILLEEYIFLIFFWKKNNKKETFIVFRDKDIGIYENWQADIHESHNDEDVETDDEQKKIAQNFSISEVEEGFEYIKNNENDAFSNFNRYDDLYRSKNWEEAMKIIENNLDIFVFNNRTKNKWKEFLIIINIIKKEIINEFEKNI